MNRLSVTAFDVNHVQKLSENEHVKRIIVGNNTFGIRQIYDFSLSEIKQAAIIAAQFNKELFVAVNKIFHEAEFESLTSFLQELNELGITGIIFSDLGVYTVVKDQAFDFKLEYSTETTITNNYFTIFANDHNIFSIDLAKELSFKAIEEISVNTKSAISINIHGHIYMYQSMRKLISNYLDVQNTTIDNEQKYYLHDTERQVYYPIIENQQGTHLLSAHDVCTIQHIPNLLALNIDYFKLDGFGYSRGQYDQLIDIYSLAFDTAQADIDQYNQLKRDLFLQIKENNPTKRFSTGFFFKETIY